MKRTTSVRVLGLLACFILLLAAGALPASGNRVTASQNCDDKVTEARIKAGLINPDSLRVISNPYPDVKVEVLNRKVKVIGAVESIGDRRAIERIIAAAAEGCIRENVNKAELRINCSKEKITREVKSNLSISLPCGAPEGSVKAEVSFPQGSVTSAEGDGVVTLTGRVPSQEIRQNAGRAAEATDCVASVINKLEVNATPVLNCSSLLDLQLKATVEKAISMVTSCSLSKAIEVKATSGVVTLTGRTQIRQRIIQAAEGACRSIRLDSRELKKADKVGPQCAAGALACADLEGSPFCCFGCRVCPIF